MQANFDKAIEEIRRRDSRYHRDAYNFVREALDYTQKTMAQAPAPRFQAVGAEQRLRHVTGQELLGGIRAYALQLFGPMTLLVLNEWGISRCEDFGEIVFNMIECGLLAKTDHDSREDFRGGYDFEQVFRQPFVPERNSSSRLLPQTKSSDN